MSDKQITARINSKLTKAKELIKECEVLAEKHKVVFSFSPAYGMGGTYFPHPEKAEDWESSNCYEEQYGWQPSSQGC
jgi:hypothetical protein